MSPLVERLRQAGADLAADLSQTFTSSLANFDRLFAERRKESGSTAGAAIDVAVKDILNPMLRRINDTILKVVVQDPLEKFLQGQVRKILENSPFGDAIKNVLDPAQAQQAAAIAAQTTATTAETTARVTSTSAIAAMTSAAYAAATALAAVSSSAGTDAAGNVLAKLFGGSSGVDFDANPFAAVALAEGTNRVPYDGMLARLHKDEAVVPAKYNPSAGGTGAPALNFKVINEASDQVAVSPPRRNSDGEIEMLIRRVVRDENARDLGSGGGVISRGLKSRGISLDGGLPRMG